MINMIRYVAKKADITALIQLQLAGKRCILQNVFKNVLTNKPIKILHIIIHY